MTAKLLLATSLSLVLSVPAAVQMDMQDRSQLN